MNAQLDTIVRLILFYTVAFGSLLYLGYGVTRFLLPAQWSKYLLLVAPLIGYCLLAIGAQFITSTVANMRIVTPLMLVLATIVNIAVWRARVPAPREIARRDTLVIWSIAFATFFVQALPLVRAGAITFLGHQWDLEVYLPITEYLKDYVIAATLNAPENPLLANMNTLPFRGGSGWGFMFLEAFVGVELGWSSFETLRPTLNFVFALSPVSVYLFSRLGLRTSSAVALIAAMLVALNGTNQWVSSMSLAGHAATFFTLPFALAMSINAVNHPSLRLIVLSAIAIAGMLLAFYTGAGVLFGVALGMFCLPRLLAGSRARLRVLRALGLMAALALLLTAVATPRFVEMAPLYFQRGFTRGWGMSYFVSLSEAFGLLPDQYVTSGINDRVGLNPVATAIFGFLSLITVLMVVVSCWVASRLAGWRSSAFLWMSVGCAALAMCFMLVIHYPYGYFNVLSLSAFLLAIGLAQTLVALWNRAPDIDALLESTIAFVRRHIFLEKAQPSPAPATLNHRRIAVAIAAPVVALLVANTAISTGYFMLSGGLSTRLWELDGIREVIPPGEPVYVVENNSMWPDEKAILAYFLRDNPLGGSLTTSFGRLPDPTPMDGSYRYAIAPAGEPRDLGRDPAWKPIWRHRFVDVYRREGATSASVDKAHN